MTKLGFLLPRWFFDFWSHTHLCDQADLCLSPSSPLLKQYSNVWLSKVSSYPLHCYGCVAEILSKLKLFSTQPATPELVCVRACACVGVHVYLCVCLLWSHLTELKEIVCKHHEALFTKNFNFFFAVVVVESILSWFSTNLIIFVGVAHLSELTLTENLQGCVNFQSSLKRILRCQNLQHWNEFRSFSAKEPLIIWLFGRKWPIKIRRPMGLRHLVALKGGALQLTSTQLMLHILFLVSYSTFNSELFSFFHYFIFSRFLILKKSAFTRFT